MATPISYSVSVLVSGGGGTHMGFPHFTAGSDANAVSVAQQLSTVYQTPLYLRRTDTGALLNGGAALAPAAPGSALGNQVTGVALSPY